MQGDNIYEADDPPGSSPGDAALASRIEPSRIRTFASGGVMWSVREIGAPAFDRRAGPSLIFESTDVIRRVRRYPSHWFQLTDEELNLLSSRL